MLSLTAVTAVLALLPVVKYLILQKYHRVSLTLKVGGRPSLRNTTHAKTPLGMENADTAQWLGKIIQT